jgi:hypothetical protein
LGVQRNEKKLTLICNSIEFMSLNNLDLTAALLSNLYPNSLVVSDSPADKKQQPLPEPAIPVESPTPVPATEPPATGWKFLGNNLRNIVIVVRSGEAVHLPDEELSFLTNMLTACKLGLADVAIVNLERHPGKAYKDFLDEFRARTVLLFGVSPSAFNLPVNFPLFQVQVLANCTFLYTEPLGRMKDDPLLKSKLWVCLRSVFNI